MPPRAATALLALGLSLGLAACQPGDETAALVVAPPAGAAPEADAVPGGAPRDLALDPAKLTGMASPLVQAALGNPNFRRRERGVEVWQYYGPGCALDLFLYEQAGQQRVAHYQLRSRPPGGVLDGACYRRLVEER